MRRHRAKNPRKAWGEATKRYRNTNASNHRDHRDHGEKNTEKRNTTEEMDASDGLTWNSGILSVISVTSVVPRSSCLPESSSRLSAPARPRGRGRLAQFSLLQRFAVWWVALPWPILPVPAVLLALCRVVEYGRHHSPGSSGPRRQSNLPARGQGTGRGAGNGSGNDSGPSAAGASLGTPRASPCSLSVLRCNCSFWERSSQPPPRAR